MIKKDRTKTDYGKLCEPVNFKCPICGTTDDWSAYDAKYGNYFLMGRDGVCFQCAFWLDKTNNPDPNAVSIDGHYYIVNPSAAHPISLLKGGGGNWYYFLLNNGQLRESNNVWHQGEIPKRFRPRLPDNAVFLDHKRYKDIKENPFKCDKRGCWDRYTCLRYDIALEGDGVFNTVPPDHKAGDEHCPSYTPKSKLAL